MFQSVKFSLLVSAFLTALQTGPVLSKEIGNSVQTVALNTTGGSEALQKADGKSLDIFSIFDFDESEESEEQLICKNCTVQVVQGSKPKENDNKKLREDLTNIIAELDTAIVALADHPKKPSFVDVKTKLTALRDSIKE